MKLELKDGLYYAELNDGRFMHVTTEVAEEFIRMQKEIKELKNIKIASVYAKARLSNTDIDNANIRIAQALLEQALS